MVKALEDFAPDCEITIADRNEKIIPSDLKHWKQCGTGWLANMQKFDIIIKSPGIPLLPELQPYAKKITSSTQIFFDSIEDFQKKIIGITGSKGKSTTASLLAQLLNKSAGIPQKIHLIGNIGNPAIAYLDLAEKNVLFVMEMSSYQLADLTVSPSIAVITSFFPEHLNYHGSLTTYKEAKMNIVRYQKKEDVVFFNATSTDCEHFAVQSKGRKVPVLPTDLPIASLETKLQGAHNTMNIALAWKVAEMLGTKTEEAIKAIQEFNPLPHRLESLGIHHGMEWVNDSISTTPESASAALQALGDRVRIIMLGGQDRGYDFSPLIEQLKTSKVRQAILLPDSGATIEAHIKKCLPHLQCVHAKTIAEAVAYAVQHQPHNQGKPIILLSPAAPSYGHFKNFEDRGNQFRQEVLKYS